MEPQEYDEIIRTLVRIAAHQEIMYHPQSGWFDEGSQRGPTMG
jgi:hypothetical protein